MIGKRGRSRSIIKERLPMTKILSCAAVLGLLERQHGGALKVNNVRELPRCSVPSQQPGNTISRICGCRCIAEGFDRADLRKPEDERVNVLAAVSRRSGKLGRQCRERIVRDLGLTCSRYIRE